MNKEKKQKMPSSGYASPTVRVIALRMNQTILSVSNNSNNTNPAEMGDEDVF